MTEIIAISEIQVSEDRQRSDLPEEHIENLRQSILETGLIHAPVITESNILVAGFCRLQALSRLEEPFLYGTDWYEPGFIPVNRVDPSDPNSLFRIELEENIRRKDLSPVDRARAIAKLHHVRVEENPGQTKKDTAKELAALRGKPQVTSEERDVADALALEAASDVPEVQKAKTHKEAVRAAKKAMENKFMAMLGERKALTAKLDQEIIDGDATVELDRLSPASVDCFVCDPPYGIGADTFGEQTTVEGHGYQDDWDSASGLIEQLAYSMARIGKAECHAYIFCDIRRFADIKELFAAAEWDVWQTPLIWYKGSSGHAPRPGYGPRRVYESIVFCSRGNRRVAKAGSDVLAFNAVRDKLHGAQKPVELLQELLSWSCVPGDLVVDPTCGVGSTLLAARTLGLRGVGIEIDPKFANIARARLAEEDPE